MVALGRSVSDGLFVMVVRVVRARESRMKELEPTT